MSWLNSYNSGNANTALPITTKSGYCLRTGTYNQSGTMKWNCTEFAQSASNLTYIAAADIPTGWIRVKIYNPNHQQVFFFRPLSTSTGGAAWSFDFKARKVKSEGDYEYYYFNVTSAPSNYLCPVYYSSQSTSGAWTYQLYYGLEIVEAVKAPAWDEKTIKVYNDGTSHEILPAVYCDNYCSDGYIYKTTRGSSSYRIWPVNAGTYTLRSIGNINNIYGLSNSDITLYNTSSKRVSLTTTSTTDPNTGETVYTITVPSGTHYIIAGGTIIASGLISKNPRLYGQIVADWYNVDSYTMETAWKNTVYKD